MAHMGIRDTARHAWARLGAEVTSRTGFVGLQGPTEDGVALGPAVPVDGPPSLMTSVLLGVLSGRPAFGPTTPTLDASPGVEHQRSEEDLEH
jgi:hypothetical protein